MRRNLVTIGGGKGQGTILQGLNHYNTDFHISAILSTFDNGGSTGRLREELGIPSFGGDFRDVMTALCKDQKMVNLFQHRYEQGSDIKGHSVGNLILLGLLEMSDWDIPRAIGYAKQILNINADVIPSTIDKVDLAARFADKTEVTGQTQIDDNLAREYVKIEKIWTIPSAQAYPGAVDAIHNADAIVLCPGDLYGSLLCNLVVDGMKEAIQQSSATIIYIVNLMSKANQTKGWTTSNFVDEVNSYLPRPIDYAIVNDGGLSEDIVGLDQYKSESWDMIPNDIKGESYKDTQIIKGKIWYEGKEFRRVSTDVIPRSFIRHNPEKIAKLIIDLVSK